MNSYDIGSVVHIFTTFTDANGNAADTTVAMELRDPQGNYTSPSVTRDSTGSYHVDVSPTVSGMWEYKFLGTGTIVAVTEGRFWMRYSDM